MTMWKPRIPSFPRPFKVLCPLSPLTLPKFISSSSLSRNRWIIFKYLFCHPQCTICLCFKRTGLSWIEDKLLGLLPEVNFQGSNFLQSYASHFFFNTRAYFLPKAVLPSLACWFTLPNWTSQENTSEPFNFDPQRNTDHWAALIFKNQDFQDKLYQ